MGDRVGIFSFERLSLAAHRPPRTNNATAEGSTGGAGAECGPLTNGATSSGACARSARRCTAIETSGPGGGRQGQTLSARDP
eukprot:273369-Pyramimonas_sp.AAC.2